MPSPRARRKRRTAFLALSATAAVALVAGGLARAGGDLTASRVLSAAASRRLLAVDAGAGRQIRLQLRPIEILERAASFTTSDAAGRYRPARRERFTTLAGSVSGDPSSAVRLTVAGSWVAGVMLTAGRWYSIEPDRWAHPRRTLIRRVEVGLGAAPLDDDVHRTDSFITPVGAGVLNCTLFPCNRLRALVVLDADVFFRNIDPATCQARQIAVFNAMIQIYKLQDTRIDLSSPRVNCRTAADLGASGTPIATYLENLRAAWTGDTTDRSTVQLSAGFSFPAPDPVGYAYLGGICSRITPSSAGPVSIPQQCQYGYSVYQAVARPGTTYTASLFLKTKLGAHELGHNFNAEHDPPSLCRSAPPLNGPIMCALLQDAGANVFSSVSAQAIRRHAESRLGSITGT